MLLRKSLRLTAHLFRVGQRRARPGRGTIDEMFRLRIGRHPKIDTIAVRRLLLSCFLSSENIKTGAEIRGGARGDSVLSICVSHSLVSEIKIYDKTSMCYGWVYG